MDYFLVVSVRLLVLETCEGSWSTVTVWGQVVLLLHLYKVVNGVVTAIFVTKISTLFVRYVDYYHNIWIFIAILCI